MQNLRLAFRQLIRTPGFTILAIITLGLGIGANTGMFSILNSILLKPLPYPQSEQLDRIDRATAQNPQGRVSPADFLDLQREMHGYGEIAAYTLADTSLSEPGQPAEMVRALRAKANFFSVLRVQPQLGRDFLPREDLAGNDRVVIISERFWKNRFGGKTDVVGRTVRVDGEPHEIVGVLPATINDWRHFGPYDFFRPLALDQQKSGDRRTTNLRLFGRRSDKLSASEAAGFIANFGARLAADFPEVNAGSTWRIIPLNETVMSKSGRAMVAMLIGLSAFVLLIGCESRQSSARSHDGPRPRVRRPRRPWCLADAVASAVDCGVAPARDRRWALLDRCRRLGHGLALLQDDGRERRTRRLRLRLVGIFVGVRDCAHYRDCIRSGARALRSTAKRQRDPEERRPRAAAVIAVSVRHSSWGSSPSR